MDNGWPILIERKQWEEKDTCRAKVAEPESIYTCLCMWEQERLGAIQFFFLLAHTKSK